jgi:hypothetical protein
MSRFIQGSSQLQFQIDLMLHMPSQFSVDVAKSKCCRCSATMWINEDLQLILNPDSDAGLEGMG